MISRDLLEKARKELSIVQERGASYHSVLRSAVVHKRCTEKPNPRSAIKNALATKGHKVDFAVLAS